MKYTAAKAQRVEGKDPLQATLHIVRFLSIR